MAHLPHETLNNYTAMFFVFRLAFSAIYIAGGPGLVRSGAWMGSVGTCMTLAIKAGNKM